VRDVGRNVLRPFFGGVETDNPDRALVLPLEPVHDHRLEIGPLDVGFPGKPGRFDRSRRRRCDVDVLIIAVGNDRGVQPGLRIIQTPTPQNRDSSRICAIRSEGEEPFLGGGAFVSMEKFR
jgi:hypothetical protein